MQIKNKFNIGDIVLTKSNGTGTVEAINIFIKENMQCIQYKLDGFEKMFFYEEDLKIIQGRNNMKLRIKYFDGATKLEKINCGNWIDVYANKDVFVPMNERAMIPLGFALELPKGWEGHLAPRSSTFKTWGIIQTNHVGVVDDTYIGDNDQWHMPVYCLQNKEQGGLAAGTWIRKGDKIGQFRIMEVMPELEFEEVESFGNADRGGFGTTTSRKL